MAGLTESELAAVRRMIALDSSENWQGQLIDVIKRLSSVEEKIAGLAANLAQYLQQIKDHGDELQKIAMTNSRRDVFVGLIEKGVLVLIGIFAAKIAHSIGVS